MNEKEAIEYAGEHGITVTEDFTHGGSRTVCFKVGDYLLTRTGEFWLISGTGGVGVQRRGRAIQVVVDIIRGIHGDFL